MRRSLTTLFTLTLIATAGAQDRPERTAPYPDELVDAFAHLPVQDGGRIKPLDTYAGFVLLRLSERRSVRIPDQARFGPVAGERLGATAWLLDVMLFQEQADDYPVFLVTDRAVLDLVGLGDAGRRKRDRYSYNELRSSWESVETRARSYLHSEEKDRTRLQNQLVHLYHDLIDYRGLRGALDAARARIPVPPDSELLGEVFGSTAREVRYSTAARHANELLLAYRQLSTAERPEDDEESARFDAEVQSLDAFLSELLALARSGSRLKWLPPADPGDELWLDLRAVFSAFLSEEPGRHASQIESIALLEAVVDADDDLTAMARAARAFVEHVRGLSLARGEGDRIDMEVAFYRRDYFWRAQWSFVLGLVLVLLSLLARRSRLLYALAWPPTVIGGALLVAGIVERSILRGRPPVSTLYETILFVAGGLVVVALILESIVAALRVHAARRVALGMAALLGAFGMFLASRHETFKGEDTMPRLQAVLDTNFWLSTHVTTVTLGYMAGLLAGFLAHVYILGKLFGLKRGASDERTFYVWIGRMIYATLCFTVLLATTGTILGGVWANDSWGRFWGWDPKENGALMIVLWNLLILHGRFGGLWRGHGVAVLAVFGNVIIAFSWWGVNLMAVGLHSYGFQSGVKFWVTAFYVAQIVVGAVGWRSAWVERERATRASGVAIDPREDPASRAPDA